MASDLTLTAPDLPGLWWRELLSPETRAALEAYKPAEENEDAE